ncbi:glycosyltransferase [Bacillus sp. AFS040349]|uniref:glycosyltransferase n=1 Tax=Bacillus sp. AFS040349 TaxID=2033502 RepID=UPI000BFD6F84|nr:glycosyltransferase [Bacillus sp. AFS040349]PGT89049.1 hypothetical protein COD11_05070 [Bacillus sp. AFS040349]
MTNRKKIVIVNNNLVTGGVQKSLVNLLNEIKDKYEVTLFLFSNTGEYKKSIPHQVKVIEANPFLKLLGISQKQSLKEGLLHYFLRSLLVLWTKVFNNYYPFKFLVLTQKKLKDFDIAISYLHSSNDKLFYGGCNEFVLDRTEAKKRIAFVHCDYLSYGGNTKKNKEIYKKFDVVATVSNGCRENLARAIPELITRTVYVRNFHNYKSIVKIANESPIVYPSNFFNIVTVARLSPEKGIIRTIYIIKKLLAENYRIKWHLIGDGPQRAEIERLIKTHSLEENIILHGNQDNPYKYMISADIFLLPSFHEAAPMVIDESKCLSLPVITTNTISAKEMIKENKEGFVCNNNERDLYKEIKKILDNPDLITKCKDFLKAQSYTNKNSLEQFSQIIDN